MRKNVTILMKRRVQENVVLVYAMHMYFERLVLVVLLTEFFLYTIVKELKVSYKTDMNQEINPLDFNSIARSHPVQLLMFRVKRMHLQRLTNFEPV